jgi:cytidylate kinase
MVSLKIAIDGPAGSGKSTVARIVAQKLGLTYIDTGAMYRAITLAVLDAHIPVDDAQAIAALIKKCDLQIKQAADGANKIYLNGEDITVKIRQQTVSSHVSDVANHLSVRKVLVEKQRQMASQGQAVLDGRDIGTVVLPDAELKIFLTASLEVRAERRYKELEQTSGLEQSGKKISITELASTIEKRDTKDINNTYGPLRQAQDAIAINTDHLTIDQVVDKIIELAKIKK